MVTFTEARAAAGSNPAENAAFTVGNTPGAALPNTGGCGTWPFTIVGSILILGAGVLLWRRRKLI
jgi:LPXTG-motif cell wall-anchored protein